MPAGVGAGVGTGVFVNNRVGVGKDARVAVAEEMIVGKAFWLSGIAVEMIGFESHATHNNNANNKITNSLRRIGHLIKHDSLLALYASP